MKQGSHNIDDKTQGSHIIDDKAQGFHRKSEKFPDFFWLTLSMKW